MCFLFLLKFLQVLWSCKKCQKIRVERGLGREFACSDNLRENVWNKMESSSNTGQRKKSLISVFACFLLAICKV